MIAVETDLRAESNGLRVRIEGSGRVLPLRLDGEPRRLLALARRGRRVLPSLRAVIPVLTRCGLRIDLVVGSTRIARAGSGVQQNALARLLRLPGAHLGR